MLVQAGNVPGIERFALLWGLLSDGMAHAIGIDVLHRRWWIIGRKMAS